MSQVPGSDQAEAEMMATSLKDAAVCGAHPWGAWGAVVRPPSTKHRRRKVADGRGISAGDRR